MEAILINAGIGIVSGVFIAGAGYFKSQEDFELNKFLPTVILGGIIGVAAVLTGMTPDVLVALPAFAGITAFVENAFKGAKFRLE
jgi:hypothetical protein